MRILALGVVTLAVLAGGSEAARSGTPAIAPSPPTLAIADIAAAPVGEIVRMTGYVVDGYRCPPCPPGAQCKPCMINSAIFVAASPAHPQVDLSNPPSDVAVIAADDPTIFAAGVAYRFELLVARRSDGGFDGRLLRSQRPDKEPIWTDAPALQ